LTSPRFGLFRNDCRRGEPPENHLAEIEASLLAAEAALFKGAHFTATERALIKLQHMIELERQNLAGQQDRAAKRMLRRGYR
jgi:hypothetical protein